MDIKEMRRILGKESKNYTDEQLVKMEETMRVVANLAIDQFMKLTPEEKKKYEKK